MKFKTNFKEIKDKAFLCVGLGYCSIQNLERFLDPQAYAFGIYGWKCDFYVFGNRVISTGYNPLNWGYNKSARYACELIKKDLLSLNKKADSEKFKAKVGGDFFKGKAIIEKEIEKIIEKRITESTEKFGYYEK